MNQNGPPPHFSPSWTTLCDGERDAILIFLVKVVTFKLPDTTSVVKVFTNASHAVHTQTFVTAPKCFSGHGLELMNYSKIFPQQKFNFFHQYTGITNTLWQIQSSCNLCAVFGCVFSSCVLTMVVTIQQTYVLILYQLKYHNTK